MPNMTASPLGKCLNWLSHGRMKLTQSTTCGQTVPRRRQKYWMCAAPRSKAVRMFSMAKAPIPTISTRLPSHCSPSTSPPRPRRTAPWKTSSPLYVS